MADALVPDALWNLIEPFLPIPSPKPEGGRPRLTDRAYDAEYIRHALRTRQILPQLAMRNTKHGSGLGRWRWVVERTFAWLNQFRRLRVRYEKRPTCTWHC